MITVFTSVVQTLGSDEEFAAMVFIRLIPYPRFAKSRTWQTES